MMPLRSKPPRLAPLSAQAKACLAIKNLESVPVSAQLARILDYLERLGLPAPDYRSILAELQVFWKRQDAKRRTAQAKAKAKPKRGPDAFVRYAWATCSPETRALLMRSNDDSPLRGDFAARKFARVVKDMFALPCDYSSFLDELLRLS